MQALEGSKPLAELLEPVFAKLQEGLNGMTRIVGTSTKLEDADAISVAALADVRRRCDQEVSNHMKHIRRLKEERMIELKSIQKRQRAQMAEMVGKLEELKSRIKGSRDKLGSIKIKTGDLGTRCGELLQSARDLRPSLTDADEEFFRHIRRIQVLCKTWESAVETLEGTETALDLDGSDIDAAIDLVPEEAENCKSLLQGQAATLEGCRKRIEFTKDAVKRLSKYTGLEPLPTEQ